MKKAVLVALTLIISVAFTTGVFAQATSEPRKDTAPSTAPMGPTPGKMAPKPKAMEYVGTIAMIDTMAKGMVVTGRKGEMTFDVSMTKWQPYKSMNEVKQGDSVTVRYMEKDGKMIASSVTKAKAPGVKQESTPALEGQKADKGPAPKPPKGGSIPQESTPATK
jgi:hypothetical protein